MEVPSVDPAIIQQKPQGLRPLGFLILERGAQMLNTEEYALTSSLKSWEKHNGDLSIPEHIRAIVWHSNRVGRLETEFLTYNDPEHGRDLWVGMQFRHKATPQQKALAESQGIVSDAINYHNVCIRLHTQGATGKGIYRERKKCPLRFLDAALEKLNQDKE
jgi:hypothetical protein